MTLTNIWQARASRPERAMLPKAAHANLIGELLAPDDSDIAMLSRLGYLEEVGAYTTRDPGIIQADCGGPTARFLVRRE